MTRQAFEQIALTWRPRMIEVGRQFFGDDDIAEDIAQEALLRLWLLRERIDETTHPEALALRITKNLCVSEWRKQKVRQTVVPLHEPAVEESVSQHLTEDEEIRRLRQAVQRLTPTEQRLFRMRHELEMNLTEITAVTGIAPRSISAMLSTAKRKLLYMLTKKGDKI
ncbi:MAG: sigma-70 family RNA polymerase sigma factor [Prevotella sp.]|nr:sigma-70 family RNA polymerase sigma factor [Prevotella sp.]